jgi:hypothetical protein
MKRKRAPGGGRKPSGPFQRNTAQLTVRMPESMRSELEASAHKRGWSLTQELLWRVRVSLSKEREEHRDRAVRALCFLISEMALKYFSSEGRQLAEPWQRDPFTFAAFKLAVGKLLDALQPEGELRPPRTKDGRDRYRTETTESLADHAAKETLSNLFYTQMPDRDLKAIIQSIPLPDNPHWGEWLVEELERDFYAMSNARRDLGIEKPKEPQS